MAQAVSLQPLTTEIRAETQVSACRFCVRLSGTSTDLSPSTFVLPCQYRSTLPL